MRIGYSEDEEFPGQFELWQANCRRSLGGKQGQAALRELEQALLALPDKRLVAHELQNEEGDVCVIGAVMKYRGLSETDLKADPEFDIELVGVELGMPRLVAWKVVEFSDIDIEWHYRGQLRLRPTAEDRYQEVLTWVRQNLQGG